MPLRAFTLMLSILWGQYLNYIGIEAWSFSKAVVNEISISFRSQYLLLEKGEYSALYVHAAGTTDLPRLVLSLVGAAPSIIFVATKLCLSRQISVVTKVVSRQTYSDATKHTFVATKDVFCRDKHDFFVATTFMLVAASASYIVRLWVSVLISVLWSQLKRREKRGCYFLRGCKFCVSQGKLLSHVDQLYFAVSSDHKRIRFLLQFLVKVSHSLET